MEHMTLERIARACGGICHGSEEQRRQSVEGVVIDSRQVEPGFLFIPIKGARVDGHEFIPAVFSQGARAVLSEHALIDPAGPYILVRSTEQALKQIARYYRESLDIRVVGITGSVGKTSTKEMIASVLSQKYRVLKTEGNYNNEIGLSLTILRIRKEHQVAVLEMGISEFGEMDRLAAMAQPDICVITNIGLCHLENLHTRDGILQAKTESFAHLAPGGIAVLNGDDDKLCDKRQANGRPTVFYGIGREAKEARQEDGTNKRLAEKQVYAADVEPLGLSGTRVTIHADGEKFSVEVPLAGEHNIYNALAATAVGRQMGLSMEEIRRGISQVRPIAGRDNVLEKDGITVIDDCYNANPVSMMAALDVLAKASGRSIAVLGDMGELGEQERELHATVGRHFAGKGINALFCMGPLSAELAREVRACSPGTEIMEAETKEDLIAALMDYKKKGDTILVKASHFMGFTDIVKELVK